MPPPKPSFFKLYFIIIYADHPVSFKIHFSEFPRLFKNCLIFSHFGLFMGWSM